MSEVLLVVVPALFTATFLFVDLRGLWSRTDWKWWALSSFGVFVLVVLLDLARLVGRVSQLEDMRADVVVHHQTDQMPYYMDTYGYRVGVFNNGPSSADHVEVVLEQISPLPRMNLNVVPSRLGHKDGYCSGDHCEINPRREHHFDILNRLGVSEWGLTTVAGARMEFAPDTTYKFKLTVSARNLATDPVCVELDVRLKAKGDWLDVRLAGSNDGL